MVMAEEEEDEQQHFGSKNEKIKMNFRIEKNVTCVKNVFFYQ
jgi:hypothetical protein